MPDAEIENICICSWLTMREIRAPILIHLEANNRMVDRHLVEMPLTLEDRDDLEAHFNVIDAQQSGRWNTVYDKALNVQQRCRV